MMLPGVTLYIVTFCCAVRSMSQLHLQKSSQSQSTSSSSALSLLRVSCRAGESDDTELLHVSEVEGLRAWARSTPRTNPLSAPIPVPLNYNPYSTKP